MNMSVGFQNNHSGEVYSKYLLDIGNEKTSVKLSAGCITFPADFGQFTKSKTEIIWNVFPNIAQNYKKYFWSSERAILAVKNIDVNELNFKIQSKIVANRWILLQPKTMSSTIQQNL